jgi:hypothetical protein
MDEECSAHWEMRNKKKLVKNLKRREHLEDVVLDGRIMLELLLRKLGGKV